MAFGDGWIGDSFRFIRRMTRPGLFRVISASTGGRPAGSLVLNPDAAVVLAVAVGRSRSQVGVFDLAGREISGDTRDQVRLLERIAGHLREALMGGPT